MFILLELIGGTNEVVLKNDIQRVCERRGITTILFEKGSSLEVKGSVAECYRKLIREQ
jgi:hypothetical protein